MAVATACLRCYHDKAHANNFFTKLVDDTSSKAMTEACNGKRTVLYITWIHDERVAVASTLVSPRKLVLAFQNPSQGLSPVMAMVTAALSSLDTMMQFSLLHHLPEPRLSNC